MIRNIGLFWATLAVFLFCVGYLDSTYAVEEDFYCEKDKTCCPLNDEYSCCPIPNAVCCNDNLHCCPEFSVCDLEEKTCKMGNTVKPMHRKRSAKLIDSNLDKRRCLHSRLTSAKTLHTSPITVSNLDGVTTTTTMFSTSSQDKNYHQIKSSHQSKQNIFLNNSVNIILCPDFKTWCDRDQTCCLISANSPLYGCCPLFDAVCCSDYKHCCPSNHICDLNELTCVPINNEIRPLTKKIFLLKSLAVETFSATKPCNDYQPQFTNVKSTEEVEGTESCLSGSKCCSFVSTSVGKPATALCCPFADGVCCSSGTHCCPRGFRCSTTLQKCIASNDTDPIEDSNVSVVTKPIVTVKANKTLKRKFKKKTVCPDSSRCDAFKTCCPVQNAINNVTESYHCCPHMNAQCCGNNTCCPSDYICTSENTCEKAVSEEIVIKLLEP